MSPNISNDFSKEVKTWAFINFHLQAVINTKVPSINETMKDQLSKIGYDGVPLDRLNIKEREDLLGTNAFFGYLQTGHRIIAFALEKKGLDKEMLEVVHRSIHTAYEEVIQKHGHHQILETSYKHALQTLCVFRP